MTPDELQQRRNQLLNQQQLEMGNLEKKQENERMSLQKASVSDWELRFAKSKLELKEKHYKVRLVPLFALVCIVCLPFVEIDQVELYGCQDNNIIMNCTFTFVINVSSSTS